MSIPGNLLRNGWTFPKAQSPLFREVLAAGERVYGNGLVLPTRLEHSGWLSELSGCTVRLKLECEQITGSFKARGAVNKVFWLPDAELEQGLVTSSTGNHALAFVHACKAKAAAAASQGRKGVVPLIYVPKTASSAKMDALRAAGANLVSFGEDCVEAEMKAREVAGQQGMTYVSPYNDLQVAAGQGTVALELLADLKPGQLDYIFVPVGGGGLISGIAAVLKAASPEARMIGCQPAASDVMAQSVRAGAILDVPSEDTLSDGTAGGLEGGSITFEHCVHLVDDWVRVSEIEIAQAMVGLREHHNLLVEGAAGMAVASFIKAQKGGLAGKECVIICCGGNVSKETMAKADALSKQ